MRGIHCKFRLSCHTARDQDLEMRNTCSSLVFGPRLKDVDDVDVAKDKDAECQQINPAQNEAHTQNTHSRTHSRAVQHYTSGLLACALAVEKK